MKRLTGGEGRAGGLRLGRATTLAKRLNCLAPRGMMVLYGQSSGPVEPFDPQMLNQKGSLFLTRPRLAHYTAPAPSCSSAPGELLGWVAAGALAVRIGRELPAGRGPPRRTPELEGRRTTGKVLLIP